MATQTPDAPVPAAAPLSLDALPPFALALLLSSPALEVADLARVACACTRLRAAATRAELPQWRRVRVVGALQDAAHTETFEARAHVVPPPLRNPRSKCIG